ncbi:hypothetical protein CKAH01_03312 [Colletotrichum kahawae]|uniref:BZIP domain-containing protein n=1 Tax=Colletotrichum kahawae TaxID=34407 RepID=A0AAD9YRJ4_COLKA|nr:hypothetical protein CKAH01_03312 [Colletotrichum kahawae]
MEAERERNRIRDNQRRSRARKKEYVQELEQRLRDCQLKGIEASAEVQQAARRVAEENQKLRQLLGEVGLGDHQVDQYLRTDVLDHGDGRNFQAHAAASRKQGHAVNALDSIMTARRPDSLDLSRPFPATGHQARSDPASAYDTASNSPSESYVSALSPSISSDKLNNLFADKLSGAYRFTGREVLATPAPHLYATRTLAQKIDEIYRRET